MNGFVLAGGRSSRMGVDKALLPHHGRPLIALAVDLLMSAGLDPHVVGARPDLASYAPIVEDLRSGCGPLGGIEAALAVTNSEINVFIPVDLPLLPRSFLAYLIERSSVTRALATIPSLAGRPEPLCAVYHRDLLPGIRKALDSGNGKVMHAVQSSGREQEIDLFSVEAVAATRGDWPIVPPLHRWFHNLNSPPDLRLVS